MSVRPVVGIAGILCLVVILMGVLGLLSVVPFTGPVVFALLIALALAFILGAFPV